MSVVHQDTLDATLRLLASGVCTRPLVLNMADDVRPGGCVAAGGGMQEESLFRRTNLRAHLLPSLYPRVVERHKVRSTNNVHGVVQGRPAAIDVAVAPLHARRNRRTAERNMMVA